MYHKLDEDRNIVKGHLYREVAARIARTAKAVEFKVQNVSACDLRPRGVKPVSEMPHKQELLSELFKEYWPRRMELEELINAEYWVDNIPAGKIG